MWIACNYTDGDTLDEIERGTERQTAEEAAQDARELKLDGVRWVGDDGFLYVDPPAAD